MILAGLSLVGLFLVITTLTPLPLSDTDKHAGLLVASINPGSLAESIGISPGSVIHGVAGQNVNSLEELSGLLRSNLGSTINISWTSASGESATKAVTLPDSVPANRGILGVSVRSLAPDPAFALERYKSWFSQSPIALLMPPTLEQAVVPYSDQMAPRYTSSVFGSSFPLVSNMLFWLWFINFNVGIFNALPISPLDGGTLYGSIIESKTQGRRNILKSAPLLLTLVMLSIVIMSFVLPYVLG
jgi:membrane-associated protease RseP (regulator of RpoE activity)